MSNLIHTGVAHDDNPPGRGSGRFPYGSGENPGQHEFTFLSEVDRLRKKGISDANIAKMLIGETGKDKDGNPIWANTTDLRAEISIQRTEKRKVDIQRAEKVLKECGGNVSEAARKLGMKNESSLRSLLDPISKSRTDKYTNTAEMLKKKVDEKWPLDVGTKTELYWGITDSTKKVAIKMLEKEGYKKYWIPMEQPGTGKKTNIMVIAPPDASFSDVYKKRFEIASVQEFTPDEGKTWWTPEFPESLDSKRIMVRYAEEGGKEKDGVIELRKGVEDLSLGNSIYSQVRIAVDGTSYAKGMAIYGDDEEFAKLPKGVDVIVNTNKKVGTPLIDTSATYNPENGVWSGKEVLKRMKIDNKTGEVDRENPFGATIKSEKEKDGILMAGGQSHYLDKDGKEKLSPINKITDEGDWDNWSKNLSSQFLSKQPLKLINQQIDLSVADKKVELDEIRNLTNPVIKKKLLEEYASGCDHNAAKLSTKGVKNQAFQVIIPVTSLKDDEVYAPRFDDGDTVALIRYPHAGIFEIPILKVNNKQKHAKSVIGNATDAVGINSKVAEQLSGADFDGDTVVVIPLASNRLKVQSSKPLEGLIGFEGKDLYKLPDDAPQMKNRTKQNEMGRVTNLITDMTVQGANEDEICRAVKHSMVVIDAEKHHLDYKKSAKDNNIEALKQEYQNISSKTGKAGGASTIFSRSSSKVQIPERKEVNDLNKMTPQEQKRWKNGEVIYHPTGNKIIKRIDNPSSMTPQELALHQAGKKVYRTTDKDRQMEVYRMDTVRDATELVRDKSNPKEMAYANYANSLKQLANEARKEARNIKPIMVDPTAKKTYAEEVASLNRKLRLAEMNSPRERQAIMIADAMVEEKVKSNPDMDYEHRQKFKAQALTKARAQVGAGKEKIVIDDREWEAIQANAVTSNTLSRILNNTDQEAFKKRATPRNQQTSLSDAKIAMIKSMSASGMYTQKEIADRLGISVSTVSSTLKSA